MNSLINPFGLNFLESFQPILIIFTNFLLIYIVWKLGFGTLRTAFIHFTFGAVLIGQSQLILITHPHFTLGIQIWWHLMFLLGLLSFVWGGLRLKQTSYTPLAGAYNRLDALVSAALMILGSGIIFASMSAFNSMIEILLGGSFIEKYSLHHFFITTFAVVLAIYMATLERTWRRMLHININLLIMFIFLMCAQHFLEIITHLDIELGELIDTISELTVIVAFIVFDIGLIQFIQGANQKK